MGVPTIVVATAGNQLSNIKGLIGEKFIEYAGWWESTDIIDKIERLFKKMKDADLRRKKRDIGRNLIDGKGGQRVVKYLLSKKNG